MINPKAFQLVLKHFDSIDRIVSKKLMRKRPWFETALTSLLCDLLDNETQEEEGLEYSISQLNKDLKDIDGVLKIRLNIETYEYPSKYERYVSQSDLGLIINYDDEIIPSNSWSAPWLLQAKRLMPDNFNPLEYTEYSKFSSTNKSQHKRILELKEILGIDRIKYLLYCPRPSALENDLQVKLAYLRNQNISNQIFDYTYGLELHNELGIKDSTLSAGLFTATVNDNPLKFGDIHRYIFNDTLPFSWFIALHFDTHNNFFGRNGRHKGMSPEEFEEKEKIVECIVRGEKNKLFDEIVYKLNSNEGKDFKIFPAHKLTVKISAGSDINPNNKELRME